MLVCPNCELTEVDIDHLAYYEVITCKVCGHQLVERKYDL